jgi:hypothetical protein
MQIEAKCCFAAPFSVTSMYPEQALPPPAPLVPLPLDDVLAPPPAPVVVVASDPDEVVLVDPPEPVVPLVAVSPVPPHATGASARKGTKKRQWVFMRRCYGPAPAAGKART